MIDPFLILAPILLLAVVGLLRFVGCSFQPSLAAADDPVIDPPPGAYSGPILVTLSDDTSSASIYYTLDGTTPATTLGGSTQQYASPIAIASPTTVKAVAASPNTSDSGVATAAYNFAPIAFSQYKDQYVAPGTSADSVATPAFDNPVAAGSLMVVWIWYKNAGQALQVESVTDSDLNTNYALAVGPTPGVALNGFQQEIWYGIVKTGGPNFTVTANFSAAFTGDKGITGHEFTGANQNGGNLLQPGAATADAAATANAACGPLPATQGGLVFAAAIFQGGATPGAGFTQMSNITGNVSEYQIATAAAPVTGTFTNTPDNWIAQIATFQ